MKFLRLILIAVLALSLPAYGFAAMELSGHCNVPASANAMGADCCPGCPDHGHKAGHDGKAKPGQHEKAGHDCKACNAYQPSTDRHAVVHALPVSRMSVSLPDEVVSSRGPDGFWRPPRSL